METDEYLAANREAWNEAEPIHRASQFEKLKANFAQPGYSCLGELETRLLLQLGVKGKAVVQVCCNNGRELISLANLGAERALGFDVSRAFLEQARELARVAAVRCEFVETEVLKVPSEYDEQFELALITVGVLGWMPELVAFFAVVRRLLKPGGRLFIYEQHPFCDLLDANDPVPGQLRHSYFNAEPIEDLGGLDYFSGVQYAAKPCYWFPHKLSDIFHACLANGLKIARFDEYPHDVSGVFTVLGQSKRLPLSYTLIVDA
jgi:SAM-dependent methyltransferase